VFVFNPFNLVIGLLSWACSARNLQRNLQRPFPNQFDSADNAIDGQLELTRWELPSFRVDALNRIHTRVKLSKMKFCRNGKIEGALRIANLAERPDLANRVRLVSACGLCGGVLSWRH